MFYAPGSHGTSRAFKLASHETPFEAHASYAAVLAQIIASYRTRAAQVSPWCALRAQLLGCDYTCPGNGFAISPQSRGARFDLDAGEIASRLQIRHQTAYRRNRVAGCAEHTMEISGLPGFDRRRRTGRERWCLAHRAHTIAFVDFSKSQPWTHSATRPPHRLSSPDFDDWRHHVYLKGSLRVLTGLNRPVPTRDSVSRDRTQPSRTFTVVQDLFRLREIAGDGISNQDGFG